jgi:hypothetical protein
MKSLYTLYGNRCINVLCTGLFMVLMRTSENPARADKSAPTDGRMIALKILLRKGCGLD